MVTSVDILPKGQIKLAIRIPIEQHGAYLERAAQALSQKHPLKGFRPGAVPLAIAQKEYGEGVVFEEALGPMIAAALSEGVGDNKLSTVGQPDIEMKHATPNEPVEFEAMVSILPTVAIGDIGNIRVDTKSIVIEPADVKKVITDLRKMQVKEAAVAREVQSTDRVVVDMAMTQQSVPVEGGVAKNHNILMDEEYYLPGLTKELLGTKKGDAKTFPLQFPKEHFQKHLAGKNIDIAVTINEVYSREFPIADDVFAQSLGQPTIKILEELIEKNLTEERQQKEGQRTERAILEEVVRISKFTDIPEIMLTQEAHKMMDELEQGIERQGMELEKYFESIGKSRDDVFIGFAPEAVKRVKASLVLHTLADQEHINVSQEEIDTELNRIRELYQKDPETQKALHKPEIHAYLMNFLKNRKTIEWLKNTCTIPTKEV